ncbi:MAG: ureF [Verrucomicrobiales bacterium]|nr:ureF [Verrucomicrobiales bacterium]
MKSFPESSSSLSKLLQLTDSSFPSGAFSHSFGLEGFVSDGLVSDFDSLRTYVFDQLEPSLLSMDIPYVRFSFESAVAQDWETLSVLDQELDALKLCQELRDASVRLGSQRLSMLHTLYPCPLFDRLHGMQKKGCVMGHGAWVHGATGPAMGWSMQEVVTSYYYSTISSSVAASMKLIRIGQVAAQKLLAEALSGAAHKIAQSVKVERSKVGCLLPLFDICSSRHETAYSRLFIS